MFRDINVTKYRKLLYSIQECCKQRKESTNLIAYTKKSPLTDFERGVIQGKHSAYNNVIKILHEMIECAYYYWENTKCREECIDEEE